MKKTIAITLITSACLLSACHKNPLQTHDKENSVEFLIKAAHEAGKKLGLKTPTGSYAYRNCMQKKNTSSSNCTSLLKEMVQFAKHNSQEFRGLTLADLRDVHFFQNIEEDYEDALFYALPEEK